MIVSMFTRLRSRRHVRPFNVYSVSQDRGIVQRKSSKIIRQSRVSLRQRKQDAENRQLHCNQLIIVKLRLAKY